MTSTDQQSFTVHGGGLEIAGEAMGEGLPVVLLHGLTATRDYVVHGSNALARAGHRQIAFDARGHGASDPASPDAGYTYEEMVDDLRAVVGEQVGDGRQFVLAGHSMGSHTAACAALQDSGQLAGLVLIGPVYLDTYDESVLQRWDRLSAALGDGGIDGFLEAVADGLDPAWRETVVRFTRERMQRHRHLDAIVRALREVPRARPFESMSELEFLDLPTLVVASHDEADPHHPRGVAEAYCEWIPNARLISEERGESPLPWQGGRLAREIASFCAEPAVADRLSD